MNYSRHIFQRKLFAWCPHIAIFEPIRLHVTVDHCDQNVTTDVEFSFLIKKRIVNILLYNIGSLFSICKSFSFWNYFFHLLNVFAVLNSRPSVCIFPRLYNPSIMDLFWRASFFNLLLFQILFYLLIVFFKLLVLRIIETLLNMKGQR